METSFTSTAQFEISGFVTNCLTEEGLAYGTVRVRLDGLAKLYEAKITDGNYSLIVDNCEGSTCYDITVLAPLSALEAVTVECNEITSNNIEQDFTLCEILQLV